MLWKVLTQEIVLTTFPVETAEDKAGKMDVSVGGKVVMVAKGELV